MNTNPVRVVVLAQPGLTDKQSIYKNMKNGLAKQLVGLGVMQLLIGILCLIFQAISLGVYVTAPLYSGVNYIRHGCWIGVLVRNKWAPHMYNYSFIACDTLI